MYIRWRIRKGIDWGLHAHMIVFELIVVVGSGLVYTTTIITYNKYVSTFPQDFEAYLLGQSEIDPEVPYSLFVIFASGQAIGSTWPYLFAIRQVHLDFLWEKWLAWRLGALHTAPVVVFSTSDSAL